MSVLFFGLRMPFALSFPFSASSPDVVRSRFCSFFILCLLPASCVASRRMSGSSSAVLTHAKSPGMVTSFRATFELAPAGVIAAAAPTSSEDGGLHPVLRRYPVLFANRMLHMANLVGQSAVLAYILHIDCGKCCYYLFSFACFIASSVSDGGYRQIVASFRRGHLFSVILCFCILIRKGYGLQYGPKWVVSSPYVATVISPEGLISPGVPEQDGCARLSFARPSPPGGTCRAGGRG